MGDGRLVATSSNTGKLFPYFLTRFSPCTGTAFVLLYQGGAHAEHRLWVGGLGRVDLTFIGNWSWLGAWLMAWGLRSETFLVSFMDDGWMDGPGPGW
jgi:hypothetical protein